MDPGPHGPLGPGHVDFSGAMPEENPGVDFKGSRGGHSQDWPGEIAWRMLRIDSVSQWHV